jgi:hypothetical protein
VKQRVSLIAHRVLYLHLRPAPFRRRPPPLPRLYTGAPVFLQAGDDHAHPPMATMADVFQCALCRINYCSSVTRARCIHEHSSTANPATSASCDVVGIKLKLLRKRMRALSYGVTDSLFESTSTTQSFCRTADSRSCHMPGRRRSWLVAGRQPGR